MLLQLASAPVFMLILFIYIKDKYEKEPNYMLFTTILFGFFSAAYVIAIDIFIENLFNTDNALFSAFIISAGVEEFVKFIFLFFLMFKNPNLNEPFDAIFYSVYVSLGFAWAENIIYVYSPDLGGIDTAVMRAVFSVPGHFLFSLFMGYEFAYFSYYKKGAVYILKTFFYPYFIHGIYNLIILLFGDFYIFVFLPYIFFLWVIGLRKIKILSFKSPFKK